MQLNKFVKPNQYIQNKMKIFILPLFFILFFILSNTFSPTIVSGKEQKLIRVGVYENSPKIYTDSNGAVAGFWSDLIENIADKENWNIRYIHGNWNECLERLSNNEIDIMLDVAFTEKRNQLYAFSKIPVLTSWSRLYVKKNNQDIKSITDLENKKIAALKGSVNLEGAGGIKEIVQSFNINCTFLKLDNYTKVFEALNNNLADAGVTNRNYGNKNEKKFNLKKTPIMFQPINMQFAFPKNSLTGKYCSERIDYHMDRFLEDNNSLYYQLLEEYFETEIAKKTVEIFPTWLKAALQITGTILFVLIVAVFISRIQIKRKTNEINAKNKALTKSEEKYRTLVENANDAIFVAQDGVIKFSNKKTEELTGYSSEEIRELPFADLIHPDDKSRVLSRYKKRITGAKPTSTYTFKIIHKSGSEKTVQLNTVLIQWEERPGTLNFLRDITQQTKIESQLKQAQKMESIGTLAGGIAHDFNNILFPIMGHTEMLLHDAGENNPFTTSLKEIYTSTLRARDLVKQILTFSRQERNELKLLKLQPVIKEVLKLVRSTTPSTIDIKQDIMENSGIIKADPTQIHQIIMNLSTNAYHAMENTGGTLNITLKEVNLSEHDLITHEIEPGYYYCLTVSDTGVGIDKNITDKIFDPFFTTKEQGKGTGMGLSVVYGIVKKMNGAIKVYSEPGNGTEFHVYLPKAEKTAEKEKTRTDEAPIGGNEHILLVDDEASIAAVEKKLLERLGYKVTSRISSMEALETFKSNPDKFDIVITDMAMPNMPGDKLSSELIKIRPDIPILLCSGFSENMSEEKAASIGIKSFLLKPIVTRDLSQKIRKALDKNKNF